MTVSGIIAIAAAVAMLTGLGAGVGLAMAAGKVSEGIARNPEASGKILSTTLIFATMSEVTAIFGFVISIMLIGKI